MQLRAGSARVGLGKMKQLEVGCVLQPLCSWYHRMLWPARQGSTCISDLGPGFFLLHHEFGEALGGRDVIFSLFLHCLILMLVLSGIPDFFDRSLSERF